MPFGAVMYPTRASHDWKGPPHSLHTVAPVRRGYPQAGQEPCDQSRRNRRVRNSTAHGPHSQNSAVVPTRIDQNVGNEQ